MAFFDVSRPAVGRGTYFGRERLSRSLSDALHRGRSVAVIGGPGTGRSSALQNLLGDVQERWVRRPSLPKIVPVYLDLAEVKGGARGLVAALWAALEERLKDPLVHRGVSVEFPTRLDFMRGGQPWKILEDACANVWGQLQGTDGWCQYAWVFDNGDRLVQRQLYPAVFDLARLLQAPGDSNPSCLVVSAGRWLREYMLDPQSAFSFMRPLFLGALNPPAAETLVRAGLPEIQEDVLQALLRACGRHPYMLQRVLTELESRGLDIGVEGAVDGAAVDCLKLFDRIWSEFDLERGVTYRGAYSAPEHALMQWLVQVQQPSSIKDAERDLGIKPLREFGEFLEYSGVADKVLRGDFVHYVSHFEVFNIWYGERIKV